MTTVFPQIVFDARRVRHLRVRGQREEHAVRTRIRVEDALRTASLGEAGRLIFVRRLPLGKIPQSAGARFWSRQVERQFDQARARMVPVNHPSAAHAEAVYFNNDLEPWLLLAERAARGWPCREWFWKMAVPGWEPHFAPAQTLRFVFHALAQKGPQFALALVRRLGGQCRAATLLDALEPEAVVRVLDEASAGALEVGSLRQWQRVLREVKWVDDALKKVSGVNWQTALLVAAALTGAGLPVPKKETLTTLAAAWFAERISTRQNLPNETNTAQLCEPMSTVEQSRERFDAAPIQLKISDAFGREFHGARTTAGGLFFVVRLFVLIGLPQILKDNPAQAQAGLPWQLLRGALRLSRARDDDAFWALPNPPLPLPTGSLWRPLLRAHQRCRKLSGLTLRQLIQRPAFAAISETHIDIYFAGSDADVRIRRGGLDLNPGWVPWLERVVQFHYERPN